MRVKGRIKNHEVVSLIDSGSTHIFLDAAEMPTLHLQLDTPQILEVKVANGSVIKTLGVCHGRHYFNSRVYICGGFQCTAFGGLCSGSWHPVVMYLGRNHLGLKSY